MEEEERGGLAAALQGIGMPLSSFCAFPKGIMPTSPLFIILWDLLESVLSVQKARRKEETTENTLEKMGGYGDG